MEENFKEDIFDGDKSPYENITTEDFIKEYRDFAHTGGFSQLVKDFVNNPYIRYDNCWWLSNVTSNIKDLDRYLKLNIPDLDSYGFTTDGFIIQNNKYVPVSFYTSMNFSEMDNYELYTFFTKGRDDESTNATINCVLKDSLNIGISIGEANEHNVGLVAMNIIPVINSRDNAMDATKIYISDGKLCRENYYADRDRHGVVATVYSLDYILTRPTPVYRFESESYYAGNLLITPSTDLPSFITDKNNIIDVIKVYEDKKEPGVIKVSHEVNNQACSHPIEGESLYDAYYKFMIEQGYFKEINTKKNTL